MRDRLEAKKEAAGEQGGGEASTQVSGGREGDRERARTGQGWSWTFPDLGSCTAVSLLLLWGWETQFPHCRLDS